MALTSLRENIILYYLGHFEELTRGWPGQDLWAFILKCEWMDYPIIEEQKTDSRSPKWLKYKLGNKTIIHK